MAKIEHIERRLQNWTRWKLGSSMGGLGFSSVNLSEDAGRDGYREAVIPTIDCEAEETDRAIMTLPSELRRTVEVVYIDNTGMEAKARKLCCTRDTVSKRIERAHLGISRWLQDAQDKRKAVRARLVAVSQKYISQN